MSAQKKRYFKIEAFKHLVDLDPKYAEKTWKVLEYAIHEIYNHNFSGLSFEELYRFTGSFEERWNWSVRHFIGHISDDFIETDSPIIEDFTLF